MQHLRQSVGTVPSSLVRTASRLVSAAATQSAGSVRCHFPSVFCCCLASSSLSLLLYSVISFSSYAPAPSMASLDVDVHSCHSVKVEHCSIVGDCVQLRHQSAEMASYRRVRTASPPAWAPATRTARFVRHPTPLSLPLLIAHAPFCFLLAHRSYVMSTRRTAPTCSDVLLWCSACPVVWRQHRAAP